MSLFGMLSVNKKWLGGQSICSRLEKLSSRSHFNVLSITLCVRSAIPRWTDSKNRAYRRVMGEPGEFPVDKQLYQESHRKKRALRPPCHAGNSLGSSLRESLLDLVSVGTNGGMNPTHIVLLLGRERQIKWFASLLDNSQAILVDALKCNVTCHSLER